MKLKEKRRLLKEGQNQRHPFFSSLLISLIAEVLPSFPSSEIWFKNDKENNITNLNHAKIKKHVKAHKEDFGWVPLATSSSKNPLLSNSEKKSSDGCGLSPEEVEKVRELMTEAEKISKETERLKSEVAKTPPKNHILVHLDAVDSSTVEKFQNLLLAVDGLEEDLTIFENSKAECEVYEFWIALITKVLENLKKNSKETAIAEDLAEEVTQAFWTQTVKGLTSQDIIDLSESFNQEESCVSSELHQWLNAAGRQLRQRIFSCRSGSRWGGSGRFSAQLPVVSSSKGSEKLSLLAEKRDEIISRAKHCLDFLDEGSEGGEQQQRRFAPLLFFKSERRIAQLYEQLTTMRTKGAQFKRRAATLRVAAAAMSQAIGTFETSMPLLDSYSTAAIRSSMAQPLRKYPALRDLWNSTLGLEEFNLAQYLVPERQHPSTFFGYLQLRDDFLELRKCKPGQKLANWLRNPQEALVADDFGDEDGGVLVKTRKAAQLPDPVDR